MLKIPRIQKFCGENTIAAFACIAILTAYIGFTLVTLPIPVSGHRILAINKGIFDSTSRALATDWTQLLRPMVYEMERIYWIPTTLLPTYAAERFLGPLASYIIFSCIFIVTAYSSAFYITRSLLFSTTLAFMFAFGTQLNYVYTYGSLIPLYLLLTYISVNLTVVVLRLRGRISDSTGFIVFVTTLFVMALSGAWWINYAIALMCATGFGFGWALRHDKREVMRVCRMVVGSTAAVLALYLFVRLQIPGQSMRHGEEEELILTYFSPILMIEDVITNFFTFLYVSLDNYFPSFISSSNSLTYIGPEIIIAEQHGYHSQYQHLVLMSHIFMWRFYAGAVAVIFTALFVQIVLRAWQSHEWNYVIIAALMLMVATGFATHLGIKMRPYNSVPALAYKVTISVSALTVLISYLVMKTSERFRSTLSRCSFVGCVWAVVFSAALTRPGMQQQLLAQVGLLGYRDPLGQLLSLW